MKIFSQIILENSKLASETFFWLNLVFSVAKKKQTGFVVSCVTPVCATKVAYL